MLKPYIDTTINYVIAGGIVGAVCGATIGCLSKHVVVESHDIVNTKVS
jgi:hypothetical protein